MENINTRKRSRYRRELIEALREILNDPSVMPNVDCDDLVVTVSDLTFGRTVRDIFVDAVGHWKTPELGRTAHDRYLERARAAGEQTYVDLTDVWIFPEFRQVVEEEVQRRMGLSYRPTIRRLCDVLHEDERGGLVQEG